MLRTWIDVLRSLTSLPGSAVKIGILEDTEVHCVVVLVHEANFKAVACRSMPKSTMTDPLSRPSTVQPITLINGQKHRPHPSVEQPTYVFVFNILVLRVKAFFLTESCLWRTTTPGIILLTDMNQAKIATIFLYSLNMVIGEEN
jgi:hypothetical protein